MKNRILVVFFALVLLVGLLMSASAKARDKVELEIYSYTEGTSGYTLSFALSQILYNKSEWLRATAISTSGSVANVKILADHPEKKNTWVGFVDPTSIHMASVAAPPFAKPFGDVRAVALASNPGQCFVTANPRIKTPEDLIGKKVAMSPPGNPDEALSRLLLQHGWGVYDKVKVLPMPFGPAADALIDGIADVVPFAGICLGSVGVSDWIPIPPSEKMMMSKKIHYIPISEADAKAVREKSGYPFYLVYGEAKTIGKTSFPEWAGFNFSPCWCVHKDMPDEVVTELCQIIYDHAKDFATYHPLGKAIKKETMGNSAIKKELFHPAAIKFYEEKGISVGR